MQTIFITGGTGYIGRRLIRSLNEKGNYYMKALVRKTSRHRLPAGCEAVIGNALDATTYSQAVSPATVFIHLVGVAHPSPSKKDQFTQIDLVSVQQAAIAAKMANIKHFVYLSVAQYPTEIMKDYQHVRGMGEASLIQNGLRCSFVRPWYVLGPGHWWPLLLRPLYWVGRIIPAYKEAVRKLDTVTIDQMIDTLVFAVEHPPVNDIATYEVSDIRSGVFKNFSKTPAKATLKS
jgi:uncharacterized protein YbjT (DUF2867 family)